MDAKVFEAALQKQGFQEIMTRHMEARPANPEHAHEFSVRGRVNEGEFIISSNGVERSYRAGEGFEVRAGQRHSEAVGPEGVVLTTGRKY